MGDNATLPAASLEHRCACLGVSDVYFVGGGGTAGEDRNDNGMCPRNPEIPTWPAIPQIPTCSGISKEF